MNRIDRLTAILIQLQTKKVVKAKEIADRFDISLRTVYRDIKALEEAGIPVGAEAGIGYFLNSDYHLPPVLFTKEEAGAFLLAGKLVNNLSDQSVKNNYENALFKIKSVLRNTDKEFLQNLESKITVFNHNAALSGDLNLYLQDIQNALVQKNVIELEYFAFYNQQQTTRKVEPVSLCHYDMNWHLIAFCQKRGDYRDFRLDRIKNLQVLPMQYDSGKHISLNEYFERMTKQNNLFCIHLLIQKEYLKDLGSVKYWYGLVEEKKEKEFIRMIFTYHDLNLFAKWILSLGNKVSIVEPIELKEVVMRYVRDLTEHYG